MKKNALIILIFCLFLSSSPVLADTFSSNSNQNSSISSDAASIKTSIFDNSNISCSNFSEFRDLILKQSDSKITKEDLNNFSDNQLANAFRSFCLNNTGLDVMDSDAIVSLFIASTPLFEDIISSNSQSNVAVKKSAILGEKTDDKKETSKEPLAVFPGAGWSTYEELREMILDQTGTAITKEELDTYSDEQLGNAFKLFRRYNLDLVGMDLGVYVRVLRALYQTKTLDWNAIEPQLAFNPNNYASLSEMLPEVEQFSTYLKTLYPEDSNLFSFKNLSVSELTNLMNKVIKLNLEISPFPSGKVFILSIAFGKNPGTKVEQQDATTPISTEKKDSTSLINTAMNKKQVTTKKKEGSLPQTSEKTTFLLTLIGVSCLGLVSFLVFRKKIA